MDQQIQCQTCYGLMHLLWMLGLMHLLMKGNISFKQHGLLGHLQQFDGFLSPALLQTQQAMFQQSIRDKVVVKLDLCLTGWKKDRENTMFLVTAFGGNHIGGPH